MIAQTDGAREGRRDTGNQLGQQRLSLAKSAPRKAAISQSPWRGEKRVTPCSAIGTNPLAELLDWLVQNLQTRHSLDELAKQVCVSRRTFTRRFRQVTGTTVGRWLLAQRLALSQRWLETTDEPIERVADLAGFGSAISLRQSFSKALANSPARYRKEFRSGENVASRHDSVSSGSTWWRDSEQS
jgi:transcriptional regulator GlxA family with amidase domain